jgi:glycosyltransferase involved in cell wall biosynthesis
LPPDGEYEAAPRPHVLWVGRIMPSKRLEWLIEAAKRAPEVIFDVVGTPNGKSDYASQLMDEARMQPNLVVHGRAPSSTLAKLYASASLLACTSELEGFPTTFLEAWSLGLPVVTTFDPDGVVAVQGLGEVATDRNEFIEKLTELLANSERRQVLSRAAKNYYESNHSVDEVARRFLQMLQDTSKC